MSIIPEELLEQLERGNVLLLVGEGINQGVLPSSRELTTELATRCDYPPEEPKSFARVASYYELTRDRHGLVMFLRERLLNTTGLHSKSALHQLVTRLGVRIIVTTCVDQLLVQALNEAEIEHTQVVGNSDVAYSDEERLLLVNLWGVLEQPESLIITEDDQRRFLDGRANLSDVLRGELAQRTWLFIGFDASDEWFRSFYEQVTRTLDHHSRRAYILDHDLGAFARAWWVKKNAEILNLEIKPFLQQLVETLTARKQPTPLITLPLEEDDNLLPLPERPYKFLDYYEAKDAAIFYGRQQETVQLCALIHAHRLVLLYGASGVGKTSLLLAGAVPRLKRASQPYKVIHIRALDDPVRVIRRTLRHMLPDATLPNEGSLVEFLSAATLSLGKSLVIILDQFEEFFIRLSPQFRAAFIAELGALYDVSDMPVKVVFSLREDWLASMDEIERRIPDLSRSVRMRLLRLTHEQAHQAITAPAERLGISYEPALLERLLHDLQGSNEEVMPPQLQLVCSSLYDGRREHDQMLKVATYERLGGTKGVLRKYLEEKLARLEPAQQALARAILEELVTSENTKAVKSSDELVLRLQVEPQILVPLLERLVQRRLLRALKQETGQITYELAHEYLIEEIHLAADTQARKQAEGFIRRRAIAMTTGLFVLLMTLPYLFSLNSYYVDTKPSPIPGNKNLIVISNGHPLLKFPGLGQVVVETELDTSQVESEQWEGLHNERLWGILSQRAEGGFYRWGQDVADTLNLEHRSRMLWYLGQQEKALQAILEAMSSQDTELHLTSVRLLEQVVEVNPQLAENKSQLAEQAFQTVLLLLEDEEWQVRYRAVSAMAQVTEDNPQLVKQVLQALLPLLEDKDSRVRESAASALAQVAEGNLHLAEQVLQALFGLLEHEEGDVRASATSALAQVGEANPQLAEQVIAALLPLLEHEDSDVRVSTAFAVAEANSQLAEQVIATLLPLLSDELWNSTALVVGRVIEANPHLATKQVFQALLPLVEYTGYPKENQAAFAIGRVVEANPQLAKQVIAALLPLLKHEHGDIRITAASTVGEVGKANSQLDEQVIAALLPLLEDKDSDVRVSAASAVLQVAEANPQLAEVVIATLLPLLEDKQSTVRASAASVLGEVVQANPQLVTEQLIAALQPRLSDEESGVRGDAASALARVYARQRDESLLFEKLKDPHNALERPVAARALFLITLQQPSREASIRQELQGLSKSVEPMERIWANKTQAMLNLATQADEAAELDDEQREEAARRLQKLCEWDDYDRRCTTSFFGEEFTWAAGQAFDWLQEQANEQQTQ